MRPNKRDGAQLDPASMDTTNLYFEGSDGRSIGEYGYSKDHLA